LGRTRFRNINSRFRKGWLVLDRIVTLLSPWIWPLFTLILALIFRKDVSHALARVGRVKYRDLELTFHEDLTHAEELAQSLASLPTSSGPGKVLLEAMHDEPRPLVGRLLVSPSLSVSSLDRPESFVAASVRPVLETIESAWAQLERAAKHRKLWDLSQPDLARLVDLLRKLRDRAVRLEGIPPTLEEARRFEDLIRRACHQIEEMATHRLV